MAKQVKATTTTTTTTTNVSRVAALFEMLPAAVQELLRDADSRNEQLDFAKVQIFPNVPEDAEFFYRTLADLCDPDEPIGPKMFRNVIIPAAEKLVTEEARKQAELEAKYSEHLKYWLGNDEASPPVSIITPLCPSYKDKKRFAALDFGPQDTYCFSAPNYGIKVFAKDGSIGKRLNVVKLYPTGVARLAKWLRAAISESLKAAGVKDEKKLRTIIQDNSQFAALIAMIVDVNPKDSKSVAEIDTDDLA